MFEYKTSEAERYSKHGYSTRAKYLESLSEESGVDIEIVETLAETLGVEEDFDGLVSMVQDVEGEVYESF